MSELYYYLRPKPAYEPIYTRGNWFWRDGERFLIKGINYFLRKSPDGDRATTRSPKVDPLADEHLHELKRDIYLFQELGLNTIIVSDLKPDKSHRKAFELLAEAGIYVIVTIGQDYRPPPRGQDLDIQALYTPALLTPIFRLINELSTYPNTLAFMLSGSTITQIPTTKLASLLRALIRDIKLFLQHTIPIGIGTRDLLLLRKPSLAYFAAGSPQDPSRADFFAFESYSWINTSSFQISGWKNMVEKTLVEFPVPMFLCEFGAQNGEGRKWEEVLCLFGREMTGCMSGGAVYTLWEYGNGYGLVEEGGRGEVRRKEEFETLRCKMKIVGRRKQEEVWTEDVKDYENWRGEFPEIVENRWLATSELPEMPMTWDELHRSLGRDVEQDSVD